jgi:hypothetical protein
MICTKRKNTMATHRHVKVASVQAFTNGHGFNITDQYHRPVFGITYPTVAEAEAARDAIEKALASALEVTAYP